MNTPHTPESWEEELRNMMKKFPTAIEYWSVENWITHVRKILLTHEKKVQSDLISEISNEVQRVLNIQYSVVRTDTEFEKGYTTAYENMSSYISRITPKD
jgi:hypothetical protein